MPFKIDKRPSGIYRIRGSHYGVTVDRSAQTRCPIEATKIKDKWEKEIFDQHVLGIDKEKANPTTFAEVALGYMKKGGEPTHLEPLIIKFGQRPISSLKQMDVDGFAAEKQHSHKANSTKNRQIYTPFIAIMNYGADSDLCSPRKWKKLPVREANTAWLTPEEAEKLITIGLPEIATRRLVMFHLGTGARAEEGALVKCRQFSPGGKRITFLGSDEDDLNLEYEGTKAGRTRSIDIPPRVIASLPDITRGNERAFLNRYNKPYSGRHALGKTLRKGCERADIPVVGPHALRHSFATWHYAVHKDSIRLQREGGWKSSELIDRYVHGATEDVAIAAIKFGWMTVGPTHPLFEIQATSGKIWAAINTNTK